MCTLAIYFRQSARYPLVVAANRDEILDRQATAPLRIRDAPWVVAGIDLVGGGTWLGVNEHGMVAGLLNRRSDKPIDPQCRSRGLLCLRALEYPDPQAAVTAIQHVTAPEYNPFNLLVASPSSAFVAQSIGGHVATTPLAPGIHVLTNLDVNDPTCPRIARSFRLFHAGLRYLNGEELAPLIAYLRRVLSEHSAPLDPWAAAPGESLCVHREGYGTRSSSLLVYCAQQSAYRFFHAPGPPCTTPYGEIELPPIEHEKPSAGEAGHWQRR